MSWIGEARELAGALRVDVKLLIHEEFQRQTLMGIYLNPRLRKLTFHGGTALRIVYGSPRFSLDLDFTGKPSLNLADVPEDITSSIKHLEKLMNFSVRLTAKRILTNRHGFLRFNLDFTIAEWEKAFRVKVELLEKGFTRGVHRELRVEHPIPTVVYVRTKEISDILVDKICAIAGRSYALPRNVYDVDFIVRNGGKLRRDHLEEEFGEWKETKGGLKRAIVLLRRADPRSLLKDINMLLPEGAKFTIEDTNRSIRMTSELLGEAAAVLNG